MPDSRPALPVRPGQNGSVSHFSADRTPVSLGIVVDTSGSMAGEKWQAAVSSIDRFFRLMSDELD